MFDSKIIFQQLLTWAWSDSGFLYTELRTVSYISVIQLSDYVFWTDEKIIFEPNNIFENRL